MNWLNLLILIGVGFVVSLLGLAGGILLLSGSKTTKFLEKFGPAIAVVILLYAIFGDLIPEALEDGGLPNYAVALLVLTGVLIAEALGYFLGRFHHHGEAKKLSSHSQATAMLIVDSLHNLADGVVLGVAFSAGPSAGLLVAASTVAHEIPQEIGDFSIMLRSKMPKRKIIKLQFISALLLVPMSIAAFFIGELLEGTLPIFLSLVAGFLLYIVLGELAPLARKIKTSIPKIIKKAD